MHARARSALLDWQELNGRALPWRREPITPWRMLLAELLLSRTGAFRIQAVYSDLLDAFSSPQAVLGYNVAGLESILRHHRLGLHKQRAVLLHRLARTLVEEYSGNVPEDIASLVRLPGVGQYIAHAVAVFAMGQAVPIVDTNVARVFSRYFGIAPVKSDRRPPRVFWRLARASLPKGRAAEFGLALLDLAATTCRPWTPSCGDCPLQCWCNLRKERGLALVGGG